MSHNNKKKYFWLKLKEDFFHDPKIKKLRRMAGGDTYTIILQKVMLLSIKDGGIVEFQGIEKTLHEELSLILDEDPINVEAALSFMRAAGFIEPIEEDRFLLSLVPQLVGSESDSAERVRKLREKRKSEPPALQSNTGVTSCNENLTTEKEKELEKDIRGNSAHKINPTNFREYIKFRLSGEGINSALALEKTIEKDLKNANSKEFKEFECWSELVNSWPKILNNLYRDFVEFGRNKRKICREIAEDHRNDFGVEISPMIFEIAFYESCKLRQGKGAA